jgi:hypothetical protein
MLFLQICQVTGGDLEAVGNLGAGEKPVSHGLKLSLTFRAHIFSMRRSSAIVARIAACWMRGSSSA